MTDRPDPDDREPIPPWPTCSVCDFKIVDEEPHFAVYGWAHSTCAAQQVAAESMKWGNE